MATKKTRKELRIDTLTPGEYVQHKDILPALAAYEEVRRTGLEGSPEEQRIARLRRDIFEAEHDFTGARLQELFSEELGARLLARYEAHPESDPMKDDGRTHFVMIAMNELDRINKEGGHTMGDRLLVTAAARLDQAVSGGATPGAASTCEIYRFSGNEFVAVLRDASAADRDAIARRLADPAQYPAAEGIDPAPLTVVAMGMDAITGAVDDLRRYEGFDTSIPEESAADGVGVAKEMLTHLMRCEQVARAAARARELAIQDRAAAEQYFGLYAARFFSSRGIRTYADLERAVPGWGGEQLRDFAAETVAGAAGAEHQRRRIFENIIRNRARADRRSPDMSVPGRPPELTQTQGSVLLREHSQRVSGAGEERIERTAAMLELRLEQLRHDRLTGLLNRREFFTAQKRRLAAGNEGGSVYIDMAFLKYFNTGGKTVGNEALKRSAELLEAAVRASGVTAMVYRLGGDEFGISFEGSAQEEARLRAELTAISGAYTVRHPESAAGYIPQELHFNFGSATDGITRQVLDDLCKASAVTADRCASHEGRRDALIQVQTMLADTELEFSKQHQRIRLLVDKLRAQAPGAEELMLFSGKALASPEIGDRIRELAAGQLDGAELADAVRDLAEWAWSYAQSEISTRAVALEVIVASRVRESLLARELDDARRKYETLQRTYDTEHALVERSKNRILELEALLESHQRQHLRYLASNDR